MMTRIVTVVGARPQFIKASAVSHAFAQHENAEEILVHTGQHYDPALSEIFFAELAIPPPRHHLGVGSGSHGAQTGLMLHRVEEVLLDERPDMVVVYGDTNSTLAGALAAAKLHVPVAHVEAGLRSFNRRMPEELNRVLTDHASTYLFCPTRTAVQHLEREGITGNVHLIGDVMFDVACGAAGRARRPPVLPDQLAEGAFVLATVHRAENTDTPARLQAILAALGRIGERWPVVVPLHPRTRRAVELSGLDLRAIHVLEPVGFLDMVWLERHAVLIVTDSGGVQKEAYFQRTPCVTIRTETEWVETVASGWNRLANPEDRDAIVAAAEAAVTAGPRETIAEYGDGTSAQRIVEVLIGHG